MVNKAPTNNEIIMGVLILSASPMTFKQIFNQVSTMIEGYTSKKLRDALRKLKKQNRVYQDDDYYLPVATNKETKPVGKPQPVVKTIIKTVTVEEPEQQELQLEVKDSMVPPMMTTKQVKRIQGYDFEDLKQRVENWAISKHIHTPASDLVQSHKVLEEAVELQSAIIKRDRSQIIDALGDVLVTIIISAMQNDVDILEALSTVLDIIEKRTGKTTNGLFVKD